MIFLLEEKIKENLDNLKIQRTDRSEISAWTFLTSGFIFGCFLAILVGAFFGHLYFLIPLFIFSLTGIVFFIIFFVKSKQIRKNNLKKMATANSRFHQIYFDIYSGLFPQGLKFDGIFSFEGSDYHTLNFSFGLEKIVWQINQTVTVGGFVVNYCLTTTSKKVAGFDSISISEQRENFNLLKFESVEFGERFKVVGNNWVQIYKLLTPKVIDNFLQEKTHFLEPKTIQINDGTVMIEWGGTLSTLSWSPDPMDFSKIHWTKRKMGKEIYQKVEIDFARFLENEKLLEPLELYEND